MQITQAEARVLAKNHQSYNNVQRAYFILIAADNPAHMV